MTSLFYFAEPLVEKLLFSGEENGEEQVFSIQDENSYFETCNQISDQLIDVNPHSDVIVHKNGNVLQILEGAF